MESVPVRIGVIVPMLSECEPLLGRVNIASKKKISLWEVHEAHVGGSVIGIVVSGTGIINSAIATQALISEWSPDAIVLVGCAGSISPEILPGDVAVGRDVAYYSSYQTLSNGTINLDLPGIRYRTDYSLNSDRTDFVEGSRFKARFIHSSEGLLNLARVTVGEVQEHFCQWPDRQGWPKAAGRSAPRYVEAVIGTADQINSDPAAIAVIQDRYGIEVEECEGAAVGQVALSHELPFIVMRGISDNEVLTPVYGDLIMKNPADSDAIESESTQNAWTLFLEMARRIDRSDLVR